MLAGGEFAGAAGPLRILMPALVIIVVSNVIGMQMLVPMDREKPVAAAAAAGAVTDLLLNFILIPHMASDGAAAATLAAEIIVLICLVYSAGVSKIREMFREMPLLAITAAAAAGSLAGIMAVRSIDSAVLRLAASGLCYFAVGGGIILTDETIRRKKERI